jgi:hypothetical protein
VPTAVIYDNDEFNDHIYHGIVHDTDTNTDTNTTNRYLCAIMYRTESNVRSLSYTQVCVI